MPPNRASAIKDLVSNSTLSKTIQSHLHGHFDRAKTPTSQEESRSPSDLVCSACREGPFSYKGFRQAVAKGHSDDTTGYCYTRAWSEIAQSASNEGCSWCRMVIRTRDGLHYDKFPYGDETGEAVIYTIYANPGDPAVKEIGKEVTIFPKAPYVDYQKALEAVKQCSDHEHCPAVEETYLLPESSIAQIPPNHASSRPTGSYVWGGNQTQKTTTANIDAYTHEGINVPLPQTIADAILVTNKLGLRYLWVDALCIVQDSGEDKVHELGIMSQIYRDAYLTISVLSAFRADHGFLPDARGPDVLPFHLANKSIGRMLLELNIPRQRPGLGKFETVVMHRPLEERGWCFQESALSARRLIFQPPNVLYKCRSFYERDISRPSPFERRSQGGQEEAPVPANDYILFTTNEAHRTTRTADEDDDEDEGLPGRWRSIAEVFQANFQDQYIAGLWKRSLLSDLLWQVWPPMGPDEAHLPRPEPYRAPTWSWASVDGKLDISGVDLQPPSSAACYEAEIVACVATPKISSLPFGEVADATLTIRVKMHPLMRDGRKCKFRERKGTRSGSQFASSLSATSWIPPPFNCLEPSPLVVIGDSDEEPDSDEDEEGDEEGDEEEGENDEDPDGDEPEDGEGQEGDEEGKGTRNGKPTTTKNKRKRME
ncbi:heterokaryon incompatibility protein-domain-containing protein [Pholiota molesta]|nr:heterokaryon incompatibility protein-domain-containing protein [Pholiota molesta]